MPVSGIVVTLGPGPDAHADLLGHLAGDERFTLGQVQSAHLPLVCDTETLEGHRTAWRELQAMPGVACLELAYHDFSDVEDFGARPPSRRERS